MAITTTPFRFNGIASRFAPPSARNIGNVSTTSAGTNATALPPLSPQDFADLMARRRGATSSLEAAMANANAARGRANEGARIGLTRVGEQFANQRKQLMASLGDRGLATAPRFAGKGTRQLAEAELQARSDMQMDLADRIAAIDAMVQEARRQRDMELAQIEAEEVRRRSDLGRLLTNIGA